MVTETPSVNSTEDIDVDSTIPEIICNHYRKSFNTRTDGGDSTGIAAGFSKKHGKNLAFIDKLAFLPLTTFTPFGNLVKTNL